MNMAVLDYHHQEKWPNGFGQLQSPINLLPATPADPSTLKIETPWRVTQEIDDQVTIRLTGTGRTRIDQDQWQLMQAHIHVPAEHQITNQHAAELHFVHQSAIGALCVVAVLLPFGPDNVVLEQILDHFAAHSTRSVAFSLDQLIPQQGTVYRYLGSLTTPPLTEGVTWYVIDQTAVTIGAQQLHRYQQLFADNHRHIQARYQRPVLRSVFTKTAN